MSEVRQKVVISQLVDSRVAFRWGLFEGDHLVKGITVLGEKSEGGISHDVVEGRDHYTEEGASDTFKIYLGDYYKGLSIEIDRDGKIKGCFYLGKHTTYAWYIFPGEAESKIEEQDGAVLYDNGDIVVRYVEGKAVFAGHLKDGKPQGLCAYFRDGYFITEGGYYEDGVLTDQYYHLPKAGEPLSVDPIPAHLTGYGEMTEMAMQYAIAGGVATITKGYFEGGKLNGFGEILTKEYSHDNLTYHTYYAMGLFEDGALVWGSRGKIGEKNHPLMDFVEGTPHWYREEKLTLTMDGKEWVYVGEVKDGKPHGIGTLTATVADQDGELEGKRAVWREGVPHGPVQTFYLSETKLVAREPAFSHEGGWKVQIDKFFEKEQTPKI